MSIKIIVTGGTFDKEYDEIEGRLFFKDTHINEMLKAGRCDLDVEIEMVLLKDSLDLTENDRAVILNRCKTARQEKIVITHGTDTMVETARFLAGSIGNKTVVLTGAMIPIRFGSSDGLFNLGSSLAFVQLLPHGIYVSMNGKYYPWNNVRKNKQIGRFESLTEPGKTNELNEVNIKIDNRNIEGFIKTVKGFVGLNEGDAFSLENIYSAASHFNLNGIVYLEKTDEKRHVNILLKISKDSIILYDPLSGLKVRPFDEIHLGLYCKPVGSFKDEYQRYKQQCKFKKSDDLWERYRQDGKLLYEFLRQNKNFNIMYMDGISNHVMFPILQKDMSSTDCVPLSLFVISMCNSLYLEH